MAKIKQSNNSKRAKSASLKVKESPYVKVAISMPSEDLFRIEKMRHQLKLSRSKFMLIAVHHWFEAPKKQTLIDQYIRAYEMISEEAAFTKALEVIQSHTLVKEDW
jgi:hypothetical protein